MLIIYDSMKTVFNTKQREDENLNQYQQCFKTQRDVMSSHIGGPIILTQFIRTMPGYDAADADAVKQCQKDAHAQFLAYIFIENSDNAKYGSLKTVLSTSFALGHNDYPKDLTQAMKVLEQHKHDNAGKKKKSDSNKNKTNENDTDRDNSNTPEQTPELSFAQLEGKCYCCGKAGHRSSQCYKKDQIPQDQWAINKARANEQSHVNADAATSSGPPSQIGDAETRSVAGSTTGAQTTTQPQWSGLQVETSFFQASDMKNWILLDNQSSTSIFCNPKLVETIIWHCSLGVGDESSSIHF